MLNVLAKTDIFELNFTQQFLHVLKLARARRGDGESMFCFPFFFFLFFVNYDDVATVKKDRAPAGVIL